MAIYDRTWYGRVMVERLEGFCSENDWQRAYNEMNEFEKELSDWGAVVIKFWVQIDKDTQLARFTERQNTPEKQWKITDEDWRNREKWDLYENAVTEMLQKTNTEFAPWFVLESNDKKYARIKAMKIVIDEIEKKIKDISEELLKLYAQRKALKGEAYKTYDMETQFASSFVQIQSPTINCCEFFHGPFEVLDKNQSFFLLVAEGRTRKADERAERFLKEYGGDKVYVLDAKELGINRFKDSVAEYFNHMLFSPILNNTYMKKLSEATKIDYLTRRYMWKVQY